MRKFLTVLGLVLIEHSSVQATGRLIPTDKTVPPLALTAHQVNIAIEEQVAVTTIEQTFHNGTDRQLEVTYYLPVPKGANVKRFSMWVNGTEIPGELVEAEKAKKIYTEIVHRTMDPGLLEYMNNSLIVMRVFPVPAKGDQKVTVTYTSLNPNENGLVEYVYPMKSADNRAFAKQEKFGLTITLKSQHPIQNIYSPSHAITMTRPSDREATISFSKEQGMVDRDFQLFYNISTKDVGLNMLTHRPVATQDGYFMLLVSPRAELSKTQKIPRDMVFVLDTSGSMRGKRMIQARNALKFCLASLSPDDRFGLMNFSTAVHPYVEGLQPATKENVEKAIKWVEALEASGGTAIDDAMASALALRTKDETRPFNIVFFTDGQPTIGETNTDKILANIEKKNNANTRIFTFGVGDDVNATFLDAVAEKSRAIPTYVRETEDIESRTAGLYAKISNPVLANLKLTTSGSDVKLNEIYPPHLPDLFHGTQLVVLGRYNGKGGKTTVTLTGMVGKEAKEFKYDVEFPEKSAEEKPFVEDLWARRKVGFLLDQIRTNGESKELREEVVILAKRYGITTPYTSYLVIPDAPVFGGGKDGKGGPAALAPPAPGAEPVKVADLAKAIQATGGPTGGLAGARDKAGEANLRDLQEKFDKGTASKDEKDALESEKKAQYQNRINQMAADAINKRDQNSLQAGGLGVDLSLQSYALRNQNCVTRTASKYVQNRNCVEVGGVWIDDGFNPKMPTVTVKAMSPAYFRILQLHPKVREVFQLGNHLVWVTPSGTALIIDQNDGRAEMLDADIQQLFTTQNQKKQ